MNVSPVIGVDYQDQMLVWLLQLMNRKTERRIKKKKLTHSLVMFSHVTNSYLPGVVADLVMLVLRYIASCSTERLVLGLRGVGREERGVDATPRRAIGVMGIDGARVDSKNQGNKMKIHKGQ